LFINNLPTDGVILWCRTETAVAMFWSMLFEFVLLNFDHNIDF